MLFNINLIRRKDSISRASNPRSRNSNYDYFLWLPPIFFVILSTALIFSIERNTSFSDWKQHLLAGTIGVLIAYYLAEVSLEKIRRFLPAIYFFTILALVAVNIAGTSALGAQRWLSIAGFNVQPSEFAKLTAIISLSAILDRHKINKPIDLLKPLSIVFIPWILIFIQPDLGTSLVFGSVLILMLYWAGMPVEWALLFLFIVITSVLSGIQPYLLFIWIPFLGFMAYRSLPKKIISSLIIILGNLLVALFTPWLWVNVLKDYQRDRLVLFLDPSKDPLGGGYHLLQSSVGIGSGGFWGTGLLNGQLTKLRFIPEQHTDFIFSALGEEVGFLGSIVVIAAFFLFMQRLLNVAREARTDFESLFVIGVIAMLIFQVIVNIFMTIGLGPVTGIPLPFMSYGRTALVVNFIALGMCLSVARRGRSATKNW